MAANSRIVRSFPYPVIEEGNLSYPNGEYQVDPTPQQNGVSVLLNHSVSGAAFLQRALSEGKAQYGCLVSVPLTGYRRLHLSGDPRQQVEWSMDVVGQPPMLKPVILSVTEFSRILGSKDEVAEGWQGREIRILKGARLALKSYLRPNASLHRLLKLEKDSDLSKGCFEVKPCEEDGFYFKVHAASDLSSFLQNASGYAAHRSSILTHVVSRCLEILKQDYGKSDKDGESDADWQSFSNLKALAAKLENDELPLWDEDGFRR